MELMFAHEGADSIPLFGQFYSVEEPGSPTPLQQCFPDGNALLHLLGGSDYYGVPVGDFSTLEHQRDNEYDPHVVAPELDSGFSGAQEALQGAPCPNIKLFDRGGDQHDSPSVQMKRTFVTEESDAKESDAKSPRLQRVPQSPLVVEAERMSDISCHRCRAKKKECLVCPKNRKHKFCAKCLRNHYGREKLSDPCPLCLRACPCSKCHQSHHKKKAAVL